MNSMVTNNEFLTALFGVDAPWVHVTDFPHDPGNIPKDQHLTAWKGDYFSRYSMQPGSNQYFTISNFYCDEHQQARRRKALYRHTPVVVLDDVKEKLSMVEVSKLPRPAWILETSNGSEQWGYILNTPCTEREKVENLLDGLVANGLAPGGKDPGMKGVTRYVRLPEGSNNKASKLVNGLPFKCQMTLWEPFNRVTIEQLAQPFAVDLNAVRRESRTDGASAVSDHPLINIPEILHIKEVRSNGRFDILCPWVSEHTGADDSGSAVFTNSDGSIGFKCHHGNCQDKTGRDLLHFIEGHSHGFTAHLKNWQILREFQSVSEPSFMQPPLRVEPISFMHPAEKIEEVSFMHPVKTIAPTPVEVVSFLDPKPIVNVPDALQTLCDALRREHPSSPEARNISAGILKHTDTLPKLEQLPWHTQVCDIMMWGKGDFKEILKDLRKQWYGERVTDADFYNNVVYVKDLNQFYDYKSRIFFSTNGFQNSFSHEDTDVCKTALQDSMVKKVDKLDYAPKQPRIFIENSITYGNTWSDVDQPKGIQGEVARWYDHFDALGWGENRKHLIQWMAHTIRHPDIKINHMIILGSGEGCGKDYLLYPLAKAMGENYEVISGEELCGDFNDYFLATKYLHINEAELGTRNEATALSNKLKPLAAAPPDKLRVNQKGIKPIKVRNIINASMTTNSTLPVSLSGVASRRFYAVWSDLNPRDRNDDMLPEWLVYWEDRWNWMKADGWKNVIHHLMYEVDLSDFNPSEPPKITEFLREMKNASKPLLQQTFEAFTLKRHGLFKSDLLTATDIADVIKTGSIFAPGDTYGSCDNLTPVKVGMMLKTCNDYKRLVTYSLGDKIVLWVLRNDARYQSMTPIELYKEYDEQVRAARSNVNMKLMAPQ